MRKLCLSTNFPYREIRWTYGILRSGTDLVTDVSPEILSKWLTVKWSTDLLIYWKTCQLSSQYKNRLNNWMSEQQTNWLQLTDWRTDWLEKRTNWWINQLTNKKWPTNWSLIERQTNWSNDLLTYWVNDK